MHDMFNRWHSQQSQSSSGSQQTLTQQGPIIYDAIGKPLDGLELSGIEADTFNPLSPEGPKMVDESR